MGSRVHLKSVDDLIREQRAKTDDLLDDEDLPLVEEWDNCGVEETYGTCSREHHMLQALLQSRNLIKPWLKIWNKSEDSSEPTISDECQPFGLCGLKTFQKAISGYCEECDRKLRFQISPSRLQAIYKLNKDKTWAAVITRRGGSKTRPRYIFDGAHRCGILKPNHCMRKEHVNLETFVQKNARQRHHTGKEKCQCARQCIGEKVALGRRDLYEEALI